MVSLTKELRCGTSKRRIPLFKSKRPMVSCADFGARPTVITMNLISRSNYWHVFTLCFFLLLVVRGAAQVSSPLKPVTEKYESEMRALTEWGKPS